MVCLLNQSYISKSPWDIRKDLLLQLHQLITRRRDRGSVGELQSVKGRRKSNQKRARANKGVKTETMREQMKEREREGKKFKRQR